MSRIAPTTLADAPAATRPMLESLQKNLGMVPKLFATIGHSPESLAMLLGAMDSLGRASLSKREVELINLYASELNGCGYCVSAHGTLARGAGIDPDGVRAARDGHGQNAREDALLGLVRRVVRTGGAGTGTELAALREAGVSDREVVEVLAHVALKAFTNAVALVAQTEIDFPKQPRLPSP